MLNTIDLFAGCGGLTDGFKQSKKFNLLAAVEWDKDAARTLAQRLNNKWGYNNSHELVLNFDIQRTSELFEGVSNDEKYGASAGLKNLIGTHPVDVVIGGPPCQAYSVAGRIRDRHGMHNDYRNYLFESYLHVVEKVQPDACIFENVQGMLSASPGGISIIERVTEAFEKLGYYISTDLKRDALFNTADFRVPQKRLRVIIVAFRKNKFPNHMEMVDTFYKTLRSYSSPEQRTVDDAISDLPKIYPLDEPIARASHKPELKSEFVTSHEPRFHNKRDIEIFRLLAEDIKLGTNKYLKHESLKALYTERTGKVSSVHKYHVLRNDKPSNTIPAHLYKDGLRHIHPDPEQARSITVREAARLQTFDDDFQFLGSAGSNYKMIGNAVPPLFAKYIALALCDTLLMNKNN